MLTLDEIKNAIRSHITYAHPEDIDDAANEILHMMQSAEKLKQSTEPKLIQNED